MDDQPFNIVAYFPEVSVDYATESWQTTAGTNSPYGAVTLVGPNGFAFQDKIDIDGWTKQGLTAFFSNQYLQRDGPYIPGIVIFPPGIDVNDTLQARDYVIITDVPLTLTTTVIHAGFMDDASDYMTIKFGQANIFMQSTTTPTLMINAEGWGTGSGQPTASGTLYMTRIIIPHKNTPLVTDSITFPAVRYVAQGVASEEPEFVYLTRLKRSYELQQ